MTKSDSSEITGAPFYVFALTLVATIGGLLFGYDTAVVNGAEKSLVDLYISPALNPENYNYTLLLINQYRHLVAIVFYIVVIIVSSQIIRLLDFKKGIFITII